MPSARRHYRITLGDALSAHERALLTGGRPGVADWNLLQSAIARPYTGYYRSIVKKTAALMQSVATNHAFNDGNKRTTIILADLLLDQSGYRLQAANKGEDIETALEDFVVETIVQARCSISEIEEWLAARVFKKK